MLEALFVIIILFGCVIFKPGEITIPGKHRVVVVAYPQQPEAQPGSVVTYPGNGN
jgi:hypothetical protein